jgi:hypothetical protein
MLKQRKHSPFDDRSSPDGSHYLSKIFCFSSLLIISNSYYYIGIKEDGDEDDVDDDECSTDGSVNSQKALVFAD